MELTAMLASLQNLDLLSVGVAAAGMFVMGSAVFFTNRRNASARFLFAVAVVASAWGIINYLSYQPRPNADISLWLLRFVMFLAVWASYFTMRFADVFPENASLIRRSFHMPLLALAAGASLLSLTPFVFRAISAVGVGGSIVSVLTGPGLALFGLAVSVFNTTTFIVLIRKAWTATGRERSSVFIVLAGLLIMLALITLFNFILPAFFDMPRFVPLGALFLFPFIAFTSYAILRFELFDVKIIATSVLVFFLSVASFIEIVTSDSVPLIFFRVGIFLLVLTFGINLIRTVLREIEEREQIQKLSDEKSEFLTFASHEIRNPITAIRGYASLIYDGTTGETNPDTRIAAQKILVRGNDVLLMIGEYLSKSKMEIGKVSFSVGTFDCTATVAALVEDFRPNALIRNLTLETKIEHPQRILINADEQKLREVLGNIIDNSLKYTKEGGVTVSVERHGVSARITVSDTGVGIPQETLPQLFKKFSRADAQKVNLLGTGVGLYLAKQFIEGMGGRIWAESDGPNKGSRFIIEFPVAAAATAVTS